MSKSAAKDAQEFLQKEYQGVLSTHSQKFAGYPFGSVAPYCLDASGLPIILISRIAQHTHNLTADPRCSLLIGARAAEDVQNAGRLTLLADAAPVAAAEVDAVAARYYRFFPESADYHRVHDFDFWRLTPVAWRYIAGFGAIHWLEADSVAQANPFAGEAEQGMLTHMNSDHQAALAHYQQVAQLPAGAVSLVGLDPAGMHLRIGAAIHRLPFAAHCDTPLAVRQQLVSMARSADWA
ncbi:HugZ family pyridoxamine 5'-phosphate oxidase [Atopomonas sediminilitoris]|uniref:HugZ family pyridoxamine 5'-phosphate oxidase n=1 Tax=Atopomonas sediminilitoris TaxID=2919919 RepID=UPI001F4DF286|nr:DUF2470 domain-containing protein [Atopomonas sediminilitoris]